MSYCNYEDVMNMSGTSAKKLGFKEDESEFKAIVHEWILQSESFINSYCHREWEDKDVPKAVKNVCARLTANIIAFNYKRRDNPIRKVNDHSIKVFDSEVFTADLRRDLKPFKKAAKVKVFKI